MCTVATKHPDLWQMMWAVVSHELGLRIKQLQPASQSLTGSAMSNEELRNRPGTEAQAIGDG